MMLFLLVPFVQVCSSQRRGMFKVYFQRNFKDAENVYFKAENKEANLHWKGKSNSCGRVNLGYAPFGLYKFEIEEKVYWISYNAVYQSKRSRIIVLE